MGTDKPEKLSRHKTQEIYENKILPELGISDIYENTRLEKPVFAFVASQPGGGKSSVVQKLKARFSGEPTVSLVLDDLYMYVPGWNHRRMTGEITDKHESEAPPKWARGLQDHAINHRGNIIFESAQNPTDYDELLKQMRDEGYQVELYIVATDRLTSLTSIYRRAAEGYDNNRLANCSLLTKSEHEGYYAMWPSIILEQESNPTHFDRLHIVSRDGSTLYENERVEVRSDQATWKRKAEAFEQFLLARNGGYHGDKAAWIERSWKRILCSKWYDNHPEAKRLELQKCSQDVHEALVTQEHRFNPIKVESHNTVSARSTYLRGLGTDADISLDYTQNNGTFFVGYFKFRLASFYLSMEERTKEILRPEKTPQKRERPTIASGAQRVRTFLSTERNNEASTFRNRKHFPNPEVVPSSDTDERADSFSLSDHNESKAETRRDDNPSPELRLPVRLLHKHKQRKLSVESSTKGNASQDGSPSSHFERIASERVKRHNLSPELGETPVLPKPQRAAKKTNAARSVGSEESVDEITRDMWRADSKKHSAEKRKLREPDDFFESGNVERSSSKRVKLDGRIKDSGMRTNGRD